MTDALCFNCGNIKFGALCPCFSCGGSPTGDIDLDILFTDHHLTRETLEQLGRVIQAIKPHASNPEVGFWAFIVYVSRLETNLLTANAPAQIAEAVDAVLAKAMPPAVEVERVKKASGPEAPPRPEFDVPAEWFAAYDAMYRVQLMARVEVRKRDGSVVRATMIPRSGRVTLLGDRRTSLTLDEVAAMRPTRGCVFSFRKRPWVEV